MPQKHGSQLSKRQKTNLANQNARVSLAIDDQDAFFGRVIKVNMARCVVNIWDHTTKRHIEVQAVLPNKKKGIIRVNDLVNVAKSHPDWEVQVAIDSKTASELRKDKRISPELASEINGTMNAATSGAAEGFEFDYDGVDTVQDLEVIKDKHVNEVIDIDDI